MQIIKLNATESTNVYLKGLLSLERLEDFTVVVADEQLKGRGQMGTKWESKAGKNLTCSILKHINEFRAAERFLLNEIVSLAVYDTLYQLQVPDLSVKWPNDILSGRSKICGILIENIVKGDAIKTSIIGIGLNVNQLQFNNLPNVSSLKLILGRKFDLDEVLLSILENLKSRFSQISDASKNRLKYDYEKVLFRKDSPSTFENRLGKHFMGVIRGVSDEGKLKVELEGGVLKEFDLKEIKLKN